MQRLRELVGAVSFHRGLALGALVGSAIAGSTIWSRIRDARRPAETGGPAPDRSIADSRGNAEAPAVGRVETKPD
jgi:hypothetical protein